MKRFFIADPHFGHKNALRFDNRPFRTIEAHDEELIRRWNGAVSEDDEVWILGDLSWMPPQPSVAVLDRLNGTKYLVTGNHDKNNCKNRAFTERFAEITPYKEIHLYKGMGVILCHYPLPFYNHHYSGWYHLYGHVHTSMEWQMTERIREEFDRIGKKCNMINIGCMLPYMDYTPRTLEEIASGYELWKNDLSRSEEAVS